MASASQEAEGSRLLKTSRATDYSTGTLTVEVASEGFGSGVTSVAVPVSVMTLPDGAVTFTVSRSVHVVFGAMALFSKQVIPPVPPYGGVVHIPSPGVPEIRM